MSKRAARAGAWLFGLFLVSACASSSTPDPTPADPNPAKPDPGPGTGPAPGIPTDSGKPIALTLSASDQAALSELDTNLSALDDLDAAALAQRHPVAFQSSFGYDPRSAKNLDLIQASSAALNEQELNKLATQGFAISARQQYPNMAYGYKTIYGLDLPVYISLDSILDAVHQSYEDLLESLEYQWLIPDLRELSTLARTNLTDGVVSNAQTCKDLDFYFAVALGLLENKAPNPVAGADAKQIQDFVSRGFAAPAQIATVELFGVQRDIDFSQFKPRGHYNDSPELQQYFRAMMWLGRTDFRMIETTPAGKSVFRRRQLEAVLALRDVIQGAKQYTRIDAVVSAFVGEHDYMYLAEIDSLMGDLGASTSADVAKLSDERIAQTIIDKGYGAQRIASQVIFKNASGFGQTFPLDRSFALFGQRYVVDSHVFSNVVYDRVLPRAAEPARGLPDPLDVAYAALGNAAALPLLTAGLNKYGYAPALERTRTLVDAHGEEFWQENLYNSWLGALRSISAAAEGGEKLPAVTQTEAWSKRMLNTQLGSWAQLRHDTILYAKQSYTSSNSCEFPDAYVDPYPEAFGRLAAYAKLGGALMTQFSPDASTGFVDSARKYFTELESISNILRDMADQQQKGVPFNAAQMAFVNDAVKSSVLGCGGPPTYSGWFARLLLNPTDTMAPTIADVHTDPGGSEVQEPRVLHVANGLPRLMVVTIDTCMGPRAYAGLAYAYHEVVTDLNRLTDEEWAPKAMTAADVPWMTTILQ